MRNKEKRKRRVKQSSPMPARRDLSAENKGSIHNTSNKAVYNRLAANQDDYGFLDSSRNRATKNGLNQDPHNKKNERQSSKPRTELAGHYNASYTLPLSKTSYIAATQNSVANHERPDNGLGFYTQQVVERRSRSRSRNNQHLEHDSSASQSCRSDRSRSKSRDIVALYTAGNTTQRSRSATPVGSLRSYIYTPPSTNGQSMTRPTTSHALDTWSSNAVSQHSLPTNYNTSTHYDKYRRSRSLVRDQTDRDSTLRSTSSYYGRRARSETRNSSMSRDAISLCSNLSTQSRALSNSEIASQNLELWMTTTSKNQRPSSKSRKSKHDDNKNKFVTLLEMDEKTNANIEKLLNNANSVKPANIKMMVIAGHTPSENWESKDELKVKSGAIVTGLYKQNEWLYVSTDDSLSGYVPYAYTKAIKTLPLDHSDQHPSDVDKQAKSDQRSHASDKRDVQYQNRKQQAPHNRSLLRNSSQLMSGPNVSNIPSNDTLRTVDHERYSLSSSNSAFIEEIMCARPSGVLRQFRQPNVFADCLVVDTDNKSDGMMDDDIRVCSDSGISEPNSNHSDELDPYVSLSNRHNPWYNNMATPGSRSSLESASPQEDCRARRMYKHFAKSDLEMSSLNNSNQLAHQPSAQINALPFGPLGERLQHNQMTRHDAYEQPIYCNISQDMRRRAQTASDIPSELKPKIPKDYNGPRATVVYDYLGGNEDDVAVRSGNVVTVLNAEDIEWIWVMRRDGVEGFMPREYVVSTDLGRPLQRNEVLQQLVVTL